MDQLIHFVLKALHDEVVLDSADSGIGFWRVVAYVGGRHLDVATAFGKFGHSISETLLQVRDPVALGQFRVGSNICGLSNRITQLTELLELI